MSAQYRQTAVTPIREPAEPPVSSLPSVMTGFTDSRSFELTLRVAKMLSASTLVPTDYRGQNGLANCAIALNMASRIGADPLLVMQNLIIIHGRPTWSSQFLIATFNACGQFSPIRYEFVGREGTDEWGCRATATEKGTNEKLTGPLVTLGLAKSEGWYGRNGSKWKTMPEMMLRYRAAAWLVRTTAPELSMGLQTAEEIHDVYDARQVEDGAFVISEAATDEADNTAHDPTAVAESPTQPSPIVDASTGEIIAPELVITEPSPIVAEWLADIEGLDTKAQIGAAAKALREDSSISDDDRATIIAALKERQEQINANANAAESTQ